MDLKFDPSLQSSVDKTHTSKQAITEKEKTAEKNTLRDSFAKSQFDAPQIYTASGKILGVESKDKSLLSQFHSFKDSVQNQMEALFQAYAENSEDDSLVTKTQGELNTYFAENPEALAEIKSGNMPEYWNVQNTSKRMFSIVMAGYDGSSDVSSFYDKAVDFVNQAYGEVKEMIGFEFPQLVLDTKEALMNGLEQFKEGKSLSEIVFN